MSKITLSKQKCSTCKKGIEHFPSLYASQEMTPIALQSHSACDQSLTSTLSKSPHDFLQPYPSLHTAALAQLKTFIDPLAAATSDVQQRQQQAARKKRKRGERGGFDERKPLVLKQIYLDGFDIDQIWEQARRILDASIDEVNRSLSAILSASKGDVQKHHVANSQKLKKPAVRFKGIEGDHLELTTSESFAGHDDEQSAPLGVEVRDLEHSEIDKLDNAALSGDDETGSELEVDEDLPDGMDVDKVLSTSDEQEELPEVFVPDKLGLNDGFFSIDDFNRQSEFLEQQDFRVENDAAASDEEDIDWDADPLAAIASQGISKSSVEEQDEEDLPHEEHGPTFGNGELRAADFSGSDNGSDPDIHMQNTNNIKYGDFFAPPPRKLTKSASRALSMTQPPSSTTAQGQPPDDDLQRTISAVRRDIFEDDLTANEDGDSAPSDPLDRRSSHQKRQAKLTEEIRRLEAAAIAKRDWTLSGEARAADRPINSLLEEDLEFERAGKPVPVITQEISEDIEALIKRRILAREFDEVIRRRPDNLATGNGKNIRRGRFELEDGKPQQSLAEIYEAEHLKTVDPEGYIDKRDEKLKREHSRIEALWVDVSAKLDALASLHFRPKPPQAKINVVADVPTITMEDPQPTLGGDVAGESMLAPQEVYKAGEGRDKKVEVGTRSGLPVAREEMTREEKVRRRRREKERIKKAGGLGSNKQERLDGEMKKNNKGTKAEKQKGVMIGDLKRGGVRVIGKKGEIRDIEGNAVRRPGALGRGAGVYKL